MAAKHKGKRTGSSGSSGRAARTVMLVLFAGGGLVLANNLGLIPPDLRERLVVHLQSSRGEPKLNFGGWRAPRAEADDPRADDSERGEAPVARSKPPSGILQHLKPVLRRRPQREPESDEPATPGAGDPPERAAERPAEKPPARRPEPPPEPDPAVQGALTAGARRAALSGVRPPEGFTREWSGGAASLGVSQNELARGPDDTRRVALTFDGHFEPGPVASILETLDAHRVHATFFLTGRFARRYPQTVRRIAARGHELANHSDSHPDFTKLDDEELLAELERAEAAIVAAGGESYSPYVRPPFGARDVRVLRLLVQHGFMPVYWSLDTLDWRDDATADGVLDRVRDKGLQAGTIVLMHCGSEATARALPRLLVLYEEQELEPCPLSALLGR